eukprot:1195348-Prorocentrum_minimum.AAC.4
MGCSAAVNEKVKVQVQVQVGLKRHPAVACVHWHFTSVYAFQGPQPRKHNLRRVFHQTRAMGGPRLYLAPRRGLLTLPQDFCP